MFVDHIKILAKAGDGGNGCVSFRREKFVPRGGPDGGDGGEGGDVILEASPHTDNLREFFYRPHYKAERGVHGKGQRKTGKSGKDLVLKVPPGTLVRRVDPPGHAATGVEEGFAEEEDLPEQDIEKADAAVEQDQEQEQDQELVADLVEIGQRFVLARGGAGGKGNWHFRSDTNQAPIEFTPGGPGDEGWYHLELRKIADIGLVGFPNAGKSTLLRALSNASPKVAAYPFTTLKPVVGVVEFPDSRRGTVADIPGLIEGAHRDVGLGHDFLRHIRRCSLFLFVVDCAAVDQRDPVSDIEVLRTELRLYDEELGQRPWLIVANKTDLEDSALFLDPLRQRFPKQEILPLSAETGEGLEELKTKLGKLVGKGME